METEILGLVAQGAGGGASGIAMLIVGMLVYKKFLSKNGNNWKPNQAYDDHVKILISDAVKAYNVEIKEDVKELLGDFKSDWREDRDMLLRQMTENKTTVMNAVSAIHRRFDEYLNRRRDP